MEWIPHLMVIGSSSGALYSYLLMKMHQLKKEADILHKWEPSAAVKSDWLKMYPECAQHHNIIVAAIQAYAVLKYQHPHTALSKEKSGSLMKFMNQARQDPRLSHCFHKTLTDKLPLRKALLRQQETTPLIKMDRAWVPLLLHFNEAIMMEETFEIRYRNQYGQEKK